MEDTFRLRVDKIFGKLDPVVANTTAPPSSATNSSLWSLTDQEIQIRKWNRHTEQDDDDQEEEHDDEQVEESNSKDPLESDLQDLSDFEDDGPLQQQKEQNRTVADDDWDVQSNIGRDRTLDFEEEEDEFDKVAVGTEQQDGDRLYMKDVKIAEYDIDELDTHCELPTSFREVEKDPRANHTAAKLRLKEDAEASANRDTPLMSENVAMSMDAEDCDREMLNVKLPKPILKKRETPSDDSRPSKRVRFMCEPKTESEVQRPYEPSDLSSEPPKHNGAVEQHASDLYSPGIPDYLRNPSKYTRYAFDSTEGMDEKSNKNAFMELFQSLRQRSSDHTSLDDDISKPVTFTPRRKPEEPSITKGGQKTTGGSKHGSSIVVTAEDIQETEVSAMEEDKSPLPVESGSSMQKAGRRYRARTTSD